MSDTTACPARIHLLLILLAAALLPPPAIASAQGAPSQTEQGSGPQVVSPESEAAFIATTLKDEVPQSFEPSADNTGSILALAKDRVGQSGASIPDDTLFLIVDRSPAVQEMSVVYSGSNGSWQILGTTHVSTGKPGRKYHYKTPVGVFRNSADILGYRAQGTYNENHVRGLGLHGMRVWDFGWQETDDPHGGDFRPQIRMEMHATDPLLLEPRMGHPDSEGCIRIPSKMNRFLDHHGIIDARLEEAAADDRRFDALLGSDRDPTPIAGDTVVVIDSSGSGH